MKKILVVLGILMCFGANCVFCQENAQEIDSLKKIIEIGDLVNHSNFDKAMSLCDETIKQYPKNPDLYYWKASIYINKKDNKNALKYVQKAIDIDANEPTFYVLRGAILSDMGEHDKAMNDFNHAIKLNPENPLGYMIRAGEKVTLGDYDGADEDFKEASKLQKESAKNKNEEPSKKSE